MRWFYNLRIMPKLIIGFSIVALIAATVGVIGLVNMNQIVEADGQLFERNILGLDYMGNAAVFYQRIRFNLLRAVALDDLGNREICIINAEDYIGQAESLFELYEDRTISDENHRLLSELKPLWSSYKALAEEVLMLLRTGRIRQAEDIIFGEIAVIGNNLQDAFDTLLIFNSDAGKERAENNVAISQTATLTMTIVIVAGVLLAVVLGIFIARIISIPVSEMADVANRLAVGDVEVKVDVESRDELGILAESFRRMIANTRAQAFAAERLADGDLTVEIDVRSDEDILGRNLREIVRRNNEVLGNVVAASEQVAAGSKQVSESSMELAQGAAEQASSVEQLTASIEEISAQTKDNADNADKANRLAQGARRNAAKGDEQMQAMNTAMDEINIASASISNIIKVIDEIAFQTNILALNAAVEAARAGQHGQGFAVVAEEVRNLAGRAAAAADETTALIESSIAKTKDGTRITEETAEALNEIIKEIDAVADLVGGIASASNEQALAIGQINEGVMQISEVVQNNSATSEESAAASEELSSQAALLKELVGNFKLQEIHSTNGALTNISPEVLKVLKELAGSDTIGNLAQNAREIDGRIRNKPQIALSDEEFGKY